MLIRIADEAGDARGGRGTAGSLGGGGGGGKEPVDDRAGGFNGDVGLDFTGDADPGMLLAGEDGRDVVGPVWKVADRGKVPDSGYPVEMAGIDCEPLKGERTDPVLGPDNEDMLDSVLALPVSDRCSNNAMRFAARLPTGEAVCRMGGTTGGLDDS